MAEMSPWGKKFMVVNLLNFRDFITFLQNYGDTTETFSTPFV